MLGVYVQSRALESISCIAAWLLGLITVDLPRQLG
jgi:hypothetical protein